MRRFMAWVLCAVLLLSVCGSSIAVTYYDSLSEKMSYQLDKGSGLVGALQLTAEGDGDWVNQISPVCGRQWQMKGLKNFGGDFLYQLYLPDGDSTQALTTLWGNSSAAYLSSDFLIDTVLSLPLKSSLITSLTSADSETNVSWYSAVSSLTQIESAVWDNLLSPYYQELEQWSSAYAASPAVSSGTILVNYVIPVDAVKSEIKLLLTRMLNDDSLMAVICSAMGEDQASAYLNAGLIWYYDGVVDALPISGDVTMTHEIASDGTVNDSKVILPVAVGDWTSLSVDVRPGSMTVSVENADSSVAMEIDDAVISEENTQWSGALLIARGGSAVVDASFRIVFAQSAYEDDESRQHELKDWTIQVTDRGSAAVSFSDIAARLRLHWYSKALNDQSTTLEVSMTSALPGGNLSLAAKFRTATPWEITLPADTAGAIDLSQVSTERKTEYLNDFISNALACLGTAAAEESADQAATDAPAESTPTDIAQ